MKLAFDLESDRVLPRERFIGYVHVLEGGPSRLLKITLSFHEQTRDFNVPVYSEDIVLHEGDLVSGQNTASISR